MERWRLIVDIEFDGISELIAELEYADEKVNSKANRGLREAAKYVKEEMEVLTNVSNKASNPHAVYDVNISGVKGGIMDKHIDVGYSVTGWRMKFVNDGTKPVGKGKRGNHKGIKAQNITQNAAEKTTDNVVRAIENEVLRAFD